MGFGSKIHAHIIYVFTILMKEKWAENAVQAYLWGIFTHKGGSLAILSDNGSEFKNAILTDPCEKLGIKRLYSNPSHLQAKLRIESKHNLLKRTLTRLLDSSNLECHNVLPFAGYC